MRWIIGYLPPSARVIEAGAAVSGGYFCRAA
jgi:hypothetical protein